MPTRASIGKNFWLVCLAMSIFWSGLLITRQETMAAKLPVGGAVTAIGDKWAVVIGVGQFADSKVPTLKYSAKDAKDFYDYLTDPTAGRFSKDHVKLLVNEEATKVNIMDVIGDSFLPHAAMPDDLVVIYVSTHGSPAGADIRGVNYIVAYDTLASKLFATGIEMKQLLRMIKERVHTNRILLVMDTCYSGAGAHEGHKGLTRSNINAHEVAQGIGSLVITSSSPDERSWESDNLQNSYFTRHLIESLKANNGLMPIDKAFNFMRQKVQSEVLKDKGELQTPVMSGVFAGPSLVLGLPPTLTRSAPQLISLPIATPGAIPRQVGGDLASYAGHMRLASKLIDEHKLWDAAHELEKATALNPGSVEGYIVLADVYDSQGRCLESLEAAKRSVINDKDSSRAHERLGRAYLRTGLPTDALRQAQVAVTLDPGNSLAHNLLGYIQEHKFNRIDQAEQEYRKALEINSLNVRALVNFGLLLESQGLNLDQAEAYFRKAVESDQDDWEAHFALAHLLYKHRSNFAEAEQEIRKAIELDPANSLLHSEYGNILAASKSKYLEAEGQLRKGVELAPDKGQAHFMLAVFLADRVGRVDEAEKEFRKAIELDGQLDEARVGLGNLLIAYRKVYDEADNQFRKALAINPKNASAHAGIALVYVDLYKNCPGAESELRKAIQLDSSYGLAHYRLGVLLSTCFRRFDEAKQEFEKAIVANPTDAQSHYRLGQLLAEHYKLYGEAVEEFHKALALDPSNSHIHTTLGGILTNHYKKHKEAEKSFRKAIELNAGDSEAHFRLGVLLIERLGARRAGEAELSKAHDQDATNEEFNKAFERYVR
ncbi:MAG: tetratricopeptide repeat protein [Candidatus Melainabacteria bacterium]|nr:tetratricopeptide repeat protein [Candidatus Melainabacteria bacterium]